MEAGINPLVFRLVGDAVGDNVIDLYVAITSVIGESYANLASDIGCDRVIQHAGSDCTGFNGLVTNLQDDTFIANQTAHTHSNTIAVASEAGERDSIIVTHVSIMQFCIYST